MAASLAYQPKPLFNTLSAVSEYYKALEGNHAISQIEARLKVYLTSDLPVYVTNDYWYALKFLYSYRGSLDTFNSYRREIERFLQWAWFVHQKALNEIKRLDIEAFIEFCQKPPPHWVGTKSVTRFTRDDQPNPEWRPFNVKISKKAFSEGNRPKIHHFKLSNQAIKSLFLILSSFYNYLLQEEVVNHNPIQHIRQKSKFIQKEQTSRTIRRLSDQQWQAVIITATEMATANPTVHERTLFIMQALYGMYLRISELAANERWSPQMNHFFRDSNNNWWFKTVGKGNKMRQIAVSDAILDALRRWRIFLGLTPLPTPADQTPLIPKLSGDGPIESTRSIRQIVQQCFDQAILYLMLNKFLDEAEMLRIATAHWLRHTGISDDVKIRPHNHVQEDAGHSSGATTYLYIDSSLAERAKTAKNKTIVKNE